ncbi:hypothetical protein F5Y09DRAFT_307789, partial [Xylaria sp. FL1042]
MEEENNISRSTLFPSNWALNRSNRPNTTHTQETIPLGTYPRDWSLSTIQESVSDTPETASQGNAAKSEFSLAPLDLEVPTSTIFSPPSFERSWTLSLTANPNQPASTLGHDERLFLSDWSLGHIGRRPDERETVTRANSHDIVGTIPRQVIPHATPSSGQELITPLMGNSSSVVPGNFRPSGYSNASETPQSDLRSANQESSSSVEQAVHVRFRPTHAMTSGSSSDLRTSHSLPGSRNNAFYQFPKPVAFEPDQTSPTNFQNSSGSSQSYRLPQPVGFGPENVTPPISNTSNHSIRSPAYLEDGYLVMNSAPHDPLHENSMASFAPPGVPIQATTLPPTDIYSWLSIDAEQLYQVS